MPHPHLRGARWLLPTTLLVLLLSPVRAERLSDGVSIAATSHDWVVTYEELDRRALAQDSARFRGLRLQEAIYEARKAALDALIAEHLLELEAKRAGESPQALLDRELRSLTTTITENDVRAWYEANQSRAKGASFEAAAADIRRLLEGQQRERLRQDLLLRLRAATPVTVLLQPPREQLQVAADEPASGPVGAPVEIIMYLGFSVPVLREGRRDRRAIETEVRREAQSGLSRLPAVVYSSSGGAGRDRGTMRARAGPILGIPRSSLCASTGRHAGAARGVLGAARPGRGTFRRMPSESAHADDRQRQPRIGRTIGHHRNAGILHQWPVRDRGSARRGVSASHR